MATVERLTAEQEFANEIFAGIELEQADLSGKEFYRCTFRHAKLHESRWARARLEDCTFEDCDLTRMQPDQLRLVDVSFIRTRLMGTDWTGLSPNPTFTFESCDLRYVSFVKTNLRKTLFRDCKATEANFIECDLIEADFRGTDLSGATFEASDLTKADLATAEHAFINSATNRVKGMRISVESAALLAISQGMRVAGYSEPERSGSEPKGRGRGRRR